MISVDGHHPFKLIFSRLKLIAQNLTDKMEVVTASSLFLSLS